MVGMVVTISPSLSLYNMVVLPAASRPTIRIRISLLANNRLKSFPNDKPIFFSMPVRTKIKIQITTQIHPLSLSQQIRLHKCTIMNKIMIWSQQKSKLWCLIFRLHFRCIRCIKKTNYWILFKRSHHKFQLSMRDASQQV